MKRLKPIKGVFSDFALRLALISTSALLLGCWLLQAFGPAKDTSALGRWLLPLWLLVLATTAVTVLSNHLGSSARPSQRRRAATLLALFALALFVRLIGADHEVGERSYQDEGTYYHHANEINGGKPWRGSFVYGHVSYYTGAFGLWLAELYPDAFASVATAWTGTDEALAHSWLVLRLLVALLSAATVAPVFGIAWLITAPPSGTGVARKATDDVTDGGPLPLLAATLAALFYIVSPVMNGGSHLIISDWPSACLATFALYCLARVMALPSKAEELRWYAVAGFFAGLAAATKYPAGTVAVAIVVVWAARLIGTGQPLTSDTRSETATSKTWWQSLWHGCRPLLVAALVAMGTFVAAMPTFVLDPHHAIFSPRGMLFGVRQYAGGGWIGVVRSSNIGYYLSVLSHSFGWLALLSLAATPFLLTPSQRRRWFVIGSYGAFFIALLLSMSLALERNVAPIIPLLSALAGISIAVLAMRCWTTLRSPSNKIATAALLAFALAWPTRATLQQGVGLARSSTREVAANWLTSNLPQGTRLFRESYTPRLDPDHFYLRRARFAARVPVEEIESDRYQYVLLAGVAFNRFFRESARTERHHEVMAGRYRDMFDRYTEVRRWEPTPWRLGPTLILLEVVPRQPAS